MVTGWQRWKATTTHKQHRQLGSEGSPLPLLVRQLGTVLGHGSLVTGYGGLAWREGHMSFCRSWGSSTEQHWSPNSRICSSCTRLDWLASAFYQHDFFVNLKIFCRLGDFRQLEDLLSTWRFVVNFFFNLKILNLKIFFGICPTSSSRLNIHLFDIMNHDLWYQTDEYWACWMT